MISENDMARFLAGEMLPEERAAFERDIVDDPQALAQFTAQKSVDAGLQCLLSTDNARVESAVMASVRGRSDETAIARVLADTIRARVSIKSIFSRLQIFRRPQVFWPISACAAALIVFGVWLNFYFNAMDDRVNADGIIPVIARLTHGTAVEWELGATREIGGGLSVGALRLKSGSVEIEFTSGARGILEGPAELRLMLHRSDAAALKWLADVRALSKALPSHLKSGGRGGLVRTQLPFRSQTALRR